MRFPLLRKRVVFTDLTRSRVGISEREVQAEIRPKRSLLVMAGATPLSNPKRASTASTVSPMTRKD